MTIPAAAIAATAEKHHRLHCAACGIHSGQTCDGEPTDLDLAAADQLLHAAEAVWPHEPPKRDPSSTTNAVIERAPPPRRRTSSTFGFGKDVTADA